MDLPELIAALDGELAIWSEHWDGTCPNCGAATDSRVNGAGVRLCRLCTEAEIGESAHDLACRVSRRMTRNRYAKLPTDDDGAAILPTLSYRDWRRLQT